MPEIEGADGARIYVEAHGDGMPVVLSCAFCTTHENFRPQVAALVEHGARVILWDYRGHGKSEALPDDGSYSPELVVEDLHRVLEWGAPDEQVVVGGLSFGGMLSKFASLHLTAASARWYSSSFRISSSHSPSGGAIAVMDGT